MKKIIKSLPLLLPLFSLVACDSYGPEIEKARATTLYAKASKQETIAQTINMSLKGSQYEADGGTGNSSKKVTSTMNVNMSLDMEKMYLHYKVKAADIEEQGGKRTSKESADNDTLATAAVAEYNPRDYQEAQYFSLTLRSESKSLKGRVRCVKDP